jgi:predicted anti-sigma-YlaC factor YlaD
MAMDCKSIQQAIYRFVYGESDSTELRKIKGHLDRCKECRQERELISNILVKLEAHAKDERTEALPDGCRDRILGKIYASLEQEKKAG